MSELIPINFENAKRMFYSFYCLIVDNQDYYKDKHIHFKGDQIWRYENFKNFITKKEKCYTNLLINVPHEEIDYIEVIVNDIVLEKIDYFIYDELMIIRNKFCTHHSKIPYTNGYNYEEIPSSLFSEVIGVTGVSAKLNVKLKKEREHDIIIAYLHSNFNKIQKNFECNEDLKRSLEDFEKLNTVYIRLYGEAKEKYIDKSKNTYNIALDQIEKYKINKNTDLTSMHSNLSNNPIQYILIPKSDIFSPNYILNIIMLHTHKLSVYPIIMDKYVCYYMNNLCLSRVDTAFIADIEDTEIYVITSKYMDLFDPNRPTNVIEESKSKKKF